MLPAGPGFDSSMARLSLLIIFGGTGYPLLCAQVMHDFQEFSVRYLVVALARNPWGGPEGSPGDGSAVPYLTAAECIAEE
jgi:hypothetical protein